MATKIGHPLMTNPAQKRLDGDSLRNDIEGACTNLQTDALDLVYLHRDNPTRDVADILGTLERLRAKGHIRHYAASNWTATRMAAATAAAQANEWQGFIANQAEWSLAIRNPGTAANDLYAMDKDMIGWHRKAGAAAIPCSAQARVF